MKFLYILLAVLPLALAITNPQKTACRCAPKPCPETQPKRCACENDNAESCAQLCGTKPLLKECPPICGSRGLPPCPAGLTCVDNPDKPGCYIAADCPGLCVRLRNLPCGGLIGGDCTPPLRCTDDPRDSCLPANGGRDCIGTCVRIDGHYQPQQYNV